MSYSLLDRLIVRVISRPPDRTIGGSDNPYLHRWYLLPRNPVFNMYLHEFCRSDDPRALHDHPWWNASVIVKGEYTEVTAGKREIRKRGQLRIRRASAAHRIELHEGKCWTVFMTGPRVREWGFVCPQGWRHWKEFTKGDGSEVGKGCD